MEVYQVNLEQNMPTVAQARIRLDQALRTARARQWKAVKLIHGYGSTGKGGAIRRLVHTELAARRKAGQIRAFVPGEEFSPFYPHARLLLETCPALQKDRDYAKTNHGITLVLL